MTDLLKPYQLKGADWLRQRERGYLAARANRYPYARVVAIVFTYGNKQPQEFWVGGPIK